MNETGLIILLAAGVIALATTIWFAFRSPKQMHAQALATAASQISMQGGAGDVAPPPPPKPRKAAPSEPVRQQITEPFAPVASTPPPAAVPLPVHVPASEKDAQNVLFLLKQAYQQLNQRQQRIESELARIEMLRSEHEAVATQVAALELAMKAFVSSSAETRQAAPRSLAELAPTLAAHQPVPRGA